MKLTGAGRIAGIIGWPVAQTLSPLLHGFWLAEHGIDGALVPLPVKPEHFAVVVTALMKAGFRGVSVTIPHKEAAFALAHETDLAARAAAAANLLIFHGNGRIESRNTDAIGLSASLREEIGDLSGRPAILLGAGGAARATVVALQVCGVSEIRILNRTKSRADQLAAQLAPHIKSRLIVVDSWPVAAKDVALVVNTTSAGMKGAPSLDLPLDTLPKDAAVCDIVYNPLETPLLHKARTRGLRTVDGLGMLMHQAVPAFEAFFGVTPKVTPALRRHLEDALRG
jgi:shikimate dehydrogenase